MVMERFIVRDPLELVRLPEWYYRRNTSKSFVEGIRRENRIGARNAVGVGKNGIARYAGGAATLRLGMVYKKPIATIEEPGTVVDVIAVVDKPRTLVYLGRDLEARELNVPFELFKME